MRTMIASLVIVALLPGCAALRLAQTGFLHESEDTWAFSTGTRCATTRAKLHQRQTECADKNNEAWMQHWEGCSGSEICKFKDQVSEHDRLFDIITRNGKEGYSPDTRRLQQVIADAHLSKRALKVVAYGSSVTAGAGCCQTQEDYQTKRWTSRLQTLADLPESPISLEVQNLGQGGSTLASRLPEFSQLAKSQADLVIIDYSMNDNGRHGDVNHTQSVADAVAVLSAMPSRPAVVFLEALSAEILKDLTTGKANLCDLDSDSFPHWQNIKRLGIPSLHYADLACAADADRSDGKPQLNYWPIGTLSTSAMNHPSCDFHELIGHMVFQYLSHMKQDACTHRGGYTELLKVDTGSGVELTENQKCLLSPVSLLSPKHGFPAVSEGKFAWQYFEDVANKPGWISSSTKHEPTEVVFDVLMERGMVMLEYLSTYNRDKIGSATCWIEGEEEQSKVEINGLWELKASLSSTVTLKSSDQSCKSAKVHCRDDGAKKFKILSVTSC